LRPAMRDPWLLLLFIANPFFIDALANGQYAFLWAVGGFFVFAWGVERQRWIIALAALWFTVSTHPIEGGLASATYVGWCLAFRPMTRRPVLTITALTAPLLIPSLY